MNVVKTFQKTLDQVGRHDQVDQLGAPEICELPSLVIRSLDIGHSQTDKEKSSNAKKPIGDLATWRLGELQANGSSTTKARGSKLDHDPHLGEDRHCTGITDGWARASPNLKTKNKIVLGQLAPWPVAECPLHN